MTRDVCVCVFNHHVVVAASSADLVRAPAGEVDAPVVQLQLDVSGGVRTIKTHEATLRKKKKKKVSEKRRIEMVAGVVTFLCPTAVMAAMSNS